MYITNVTASWSWNNLAYFQNGFLDEVKQYTEQARQWNVNRLHLLVGFVVVVTAVNVGAVVWRYK